MTNAARKLIQKDVVQNANLEAPKKLASDKIRFVSKADEKYMLGIPIAGIFITIGLWILGRFDISFMVTDTHDLISSLIFIDSIHLVFSFVLMMSLPELKQWARSNQAREKSGWLKGLKPNARFLVVAAMLGVIIYVLKVAPTTMALRGMATTWLFLEMLGPTHHTLAQMKGISLCYNSSIRRSREFTPAELSLAAICEKAERYLFNGLLWGEILYWIPEIFEKDKFEIPFINDIQNIGMFLAIASVAGLLVNALYFPRQSESNKMAFLLRVVLFPLKMLSIIGGIFVRAAHGTEYIVIFRRMVKGSQISNEKKRKVYWAAAAAAALWLVPFVLTWPDAIKETLGYDLSDAVLAWAVLVTFIIRFTHYYMDSVIFRMGDPATRAAVAPLLSALAPTDRKLPVGIKRI